MPAGNTWSHFPAVRAEHRQHAATMMRRQEINKTREGNRPGGNGGRVGEWEGCTHSRTFNNIWPLTLPPDRAGMKRNAKSAQARLCFPHKYDDTSCYEVTTLAFPYAKPIFATGLFRRLVQPNVATHPAAVTLPLYTPSTVRGFRSPYTRTHVTARHTQDIQRSTCGTLEPGRGGAGRKLPVFSWRGMITIVSVIALS